MSDIKTVTLDGGELKVEGLNGQNTEIINKSGGAVYASKSPGIVPEADGVIEIAANTRDGLHGTNGTLYLLGTGKVELRGTDYAVNFRQPSSSTGGGGDISNVTVFNGVVGEGLPAFRQRGVENDTLPYDKLSNGDFYLHISKSYSINDSNGYYTDANVAGTEKSFDLKGYSKAVISAIPFKNSTALSAKVYFKIGDAEPSVSHVPYDFSSWEHICDVEKVSTSYDAPGEPVTFEIDISDVDEGAVNFGVYHGDNVSGYTAYFYVLSIDFLK